MPITGAQPENGGGKPQKANGPMRNTKRIGATGLIKRSVVLHGHATSVALERAFWDALTSWAEREGKSVAALIASIDRGREDVSLASALRVAILTDALDRAKG